MNRHLLISYKLMTNVFSYKPSMPSSFLHLNYGEAHPGHQIN